MLRCNHQRLVDAKGASGCRKQMLSTPKGETYTHTQAELNPREQLFSSKMVFVLPGTQNVALLPPVGLALPYSLLQPSLPILSFLPLASSSSYPCIFPHPYPHVYLFIPLIPLSSFPIIPILSSPLFSLPLRFSHPAFLLQAGGQGQGTTTLILLTNPYCFPCRPNCSEAWPGEL